MILKLFLRVLGTRQLSGRAQVPTPDSNGIALLLHFSYIYHVNNSFWTLKKRKITELFKLQV